MKALLNGAREISTPSNFRQFVKPGGYRKAFEDFKSLGPYNIYEYTLPNRVRRNFWYDTRSKKLYRWKGLHMGLYRIVSRSVTWIRLASVLYYHIIARKDSCHILLNEGFLKSVDMVLQWVFSQKYFFPLGKPFVLRQLSLLSEAWNWWGIQ